MDFHLTVTNYVGSVSTAVNCLFVIFIFISPPRNLGLFRSQYYVGAFASFLFAAAQLWTANVFYPDGTVFVIFSARQVGKFGFQSFLAALNLQFLMLSSNFAARYAAVRGGRMHSYLTKQAQFYIYLLICVLSTNIPLILLFSPTDELRNILHSMHADRINFDFINEYYFVCSFDNLTLKNRLIYYSIFVMAVGFQGMCLLTMFVCGVATYLHISRNTHSRKLKEVNTRLLYAKSVQACFSFLFLFMPGLIINFSMLLRIDASRAAPFICSTMTLATFFNPFVDIALTPQYRKRVMRMIFHNTTIKSQVECSISIVNAPLKKKSSTRAIIVNVK